MQNLYSNYIQQDDQDIEFEESATELDQIINNQNDFSNIELDSEMTDTENGDLIYQQFNNDSSTTQMSNDIILTKPNPISE